MPVQIKPRVKTTPGSQGKKSGASTGAAIGAGLGGVIGGVTGFIGGTVAGGVAGGPAGAAAGGSMAAAKGAVAGAATGAGLGGIAGGLIQPGHEGSAGSQEYISQVPTQQVSQGSQQILDGIRSLKNMPDARAKYLQPLTNAYMKTQMELKRRG
jgi:hypothetical protein